MNTKERARELYILAGQKALNIRNSAYQRAIKKICELQLELDEFTEDATSRAVFGEVKNIREATIIAKSDGVVAGVDELTWFINTHTPLRARQTCKNGTYTKSRSAIMNVSGQLSLLMSYERMLLNMLGHLSGIATAARILCSMLGPIKNAPLIATTRKTRFGSLDKAAGLAGGAGTHRINLKDAVIIKHNHLHSVKVPLVQLLNDSLRRAEKIPSVRFFEVEVTTPRDALTVAQFFEKNRSSKLPCVLMLDNFPFPHAQKLIAQLHAHYPHHSFIIELSGGITKNTVKSFSKTGADVLSLGSITHSAPFFDVSMRMK